MKPEWKKVVRSTLEALVGLTVVLPILLPALGVVTTAGAGAVVLAVNAAVARYLGQLGFKPGSDE